MREISISNCLFSLVIVFICVIWATAQSNTFTYQGKLSDGGAPASGTYLMQFSLWDSASGGNQIGPTLTFDGSSGLAAVQVVNGIFTVQLDFGVPNPPTDPTPRFDGNPRWIAIAVRKPVELNYTSLTPRQPVTSSPYAIKSASASTADAATTATTANSALTANSATTAATASNALDLGGIAANQYVVTTDSRLSDARSPLPGSGNYIQNGTSQQAASNFNISGNGILGGKLGVGNNNPQFKMQLTDSSNTGLRVETNSTGGTVASFGGNGDFMVDAPGNAGGRFWITEAGDTFFGANTTGISVHVNGRFAVGGILQPAGDTVSFTSNAANKVAMGAYSSQSDAPVIRLANSNATGIGILAAGGNATIPDLHGFNFGVGAYGVSQAIEADYTSLSALGVGFAIFAHGPMGNAAIDEFDGTTQFKIAGAGVVSTVVKDSVQQNRLLFAPESPEVLFEDYGIGKLIDGKAQIKMDPMFAANVMIDEKHPLRVFVQLEGDCNGVYVTNKTVDGFDVVELANGESNVSFSWHVVANRKDEELGGTFRTDGTVAPKRISHYQDLRFPVQKDVRQMLQTQPQVKEP